MSSQNGCLLLAVLCVTFVYGVRGCTEDPIHLSAVGENAVENFKSNDACAVFYTDADADLRMKMYIRTGAFLSSTLVTGAFGSLYGLLQGVFGSSESEVLYSEGQYFTVYFYSREERAHASVMVTAIPGDDPHEAEEVDPPGACEKSAIPSTNAPSLAASKIVGGADAKPHEYPFFASLAGGRNYDFHFCGGSVLNESCILTAAHCVSISSPSSFKVIVGEHDLNNPNPFTKTYGVVSITMHANYQSASTGFDIAVVCVDSTIEFNIGVKPICLPNSGSADPEGMLGVIGFGRLQSGGSTPSILQAVVVPAVDKITCNSPGSYGGYVTATMICAGADGLDSCQGDSGGPLFQGANANEKQVGIVSWGFGCAAPNFPGVYAKVSYFIPWLTG